MALGNRQTMLHGRAGTSSKHTATGAHVVFCWAHRRFTALALVMTLFYFFAANMRAQLISSPTNIAPPMGWNSWDSFGTTVTEEDVRTNALWLHEHLQEHGWRYVVVDMEWFTQNPTAEGNRKNQRRSIDEYGRFIPAVNRFPSSANGRGFRPLASYIHSLGLQFGIHILKGIPGEAMVANSPIETSPWRAADAGDPTHACAWNSDYVDSKDNGAAQAYYDSIARLYAAWEVDFIKVDCIAAPEFKGNDLKMLRAALDKTGRRILLSTSPGEPSIEHAPELQRSADQWRISNDVWDIWHGTNSYPQGLGDQFARTMYWNKTRVEGKWPDADMLPLGELRPAPGWGKPRSSRLSLDEQRSMLTLWAMFRSPMMIGGNLPLTSDVTLRLLANDEVIAVDQHSNGNTSALLRPDVAVWTARPDGTSLSLPTTDIYLAVFNLTDAARHIDLSWEDIGVPPGRYKARDLWKHLDLGEMRVTSYDVAGHGSVMLRLSRIP